MYHERSKEVNLFQIYNMDSGNAMELDSHVDPNESSFRSTEVNLCLLGKRIASYKFCLGRTRISMTMKFINEVVNGGLTIILFVVTNLVCVPKKRNLSIFRGLKGAWKDIRTLEWKWKRDGTPVPSEMVRSLAQEEGLIRIILTWFCFIKTTGSGSSPTRIE